MHAYGARSVVNLYRYKACPMCQSLSVPPDPDVHITPMVSRGQRQGARGPGWVGGNRALDGVPIPAFSYPGEPFLFSPLFRGGPTKKISEISKIKKIIFIADLLGSTPPRVSHQTYSKVFKQELDLQLARENKDSSSQPSVVALAEN